MKIQKTIQRGTAKIEAEFSPLNWAGSAYRKFQSEVLQKANGNTLMVTSRGQKAIRLDKRPQPDLPAVTTEITLVTCRGTGTRKIKIINN